MKLALLAIAALQLPVADCGHGHDDDDHSHEGEAHLYCQGDEDPLEVGFSKAGEMGNLEIQIVDWAPDPLVVEGSNSLTVRLAEIGGGAVDGSIDEVEIWQRVHDHGVPEAPQVAAGASPGEFVVSNMKVLHTGSWLFRFDVSGGGTSDFIELNFGIECPEGEPPE